MVDTSLQSQLVGLFTLTALEIVLGVDNIVFVAILSGRLPEQERAKGRMLGLLIGVLVRIALLFGISFIMELKNDLFRLPILDKGISGKSLILLAGGAFLIANSVREIHHKLDQDDHENADGNKAVSFASVMVNMAIINVVFSLDSVITAVGMSGILWVMITAVLLSTVVMIIFAGTISNFIEKHPSAKLLALSFLILIGSVLVVEGWDPNKAHDMHIKNYVYFAMAYAFIIELLNIRLRKRGAKPVKLHNTPSLSEVAPPSKQQAS